MTSTRSPPRFEARVQRSRHWRVSIGLRTARSKGASEMPVEFGIWRVDGERTSPVTTSSLANEAQLEAIIQDDPTILGLDVLLIVGRQVITTFGTRVDLLAIDSDGMLYIIEVKK